MGTTIEMEEKCYQREKWLLDFFLTENDVLGDDIGEFVFVETTSEYEDDSGSSQGRGEMVKIYLPNNLQRHEEK